MKTNLIATWITQNWDNLSSLYTDFRKDTNDTATSFTDFCVYMYGQCKH